MFTSKARSASIKIAVTLAAALALFAPLASAAAPSFAVPKCTASDDPLPEACTPKPRPAPAPPATLSYTFSPPAGAAVAIQPYWNGSAMPQYSFGQSTPYSVYFACSNGYHSYQSFIYSGDQLSGQLWMPSLVTGPGVMAGTCTATSYDVASLGLTAVKGYVSASSSFAQYGVYFQ